MLRYLDTAFNWFKFTTLVRRFFASEEAKEAEEEEESSDNNEWVPSSVPWFVEEERPLSQPPPPPPPPPSQPSPLQPRRNVYTIRRRRHPFGGADGCSDSTTVIADLQGYYRNGQFVIKLLTVLRIPRNPEEDECLHTYTFKPPCHVYELSEQDKRTKAWIENYHPATPPWTSGTYPYWERRDVIRQAFEGVSKIYVKGIQKRKWLSEYVDCSVEDLDVYGCPPLKQCVDAHRKLYKLFTNTLQINFEAIGIQHVLGLFHWMVTNHYNVLW